MKKIDLRSDTVTKPDAAMLNAMMHAEVGDDVFNEDPTVNSLQEKAAAMFGMEAALFCSSGTMTNQVAIKAHTKPGDELICDMNAHIYHYESGGIAFNSGVQAKMLPGDRGRITAEMIENSINPDLDWLTDTTLVCLENTINKAGGSYYHLEEIRKISDMCKRKNLKFHLDGARLFNALVETKETPLQYGELFDSISICLSKGLGAPVGSLLIGTKEFIKRSRKIRKAFGGNMRQAGYLAAAGIYALENNVARLKDDHTKAKTLADTVSKKSFVKNVLPADTNIVIFDLDEKMPMTKFAQLMKEKDIVFSQFGPQTVRFVTHKDFTDDMLSVTVEAIKNM